MIDATAILRSALNAPCSTVARNGAGTPAITAMVPATSFHTAVISSGTNDADSPDLPGRLNRLRRAVSARYVLWILPYDRRAASFVRFTAGRYGDNVVDLAGLATRDGIHPSSSRGLAYAIRRGGYAGGR